MSTVELLGISRWYYLACLVRSLVFIHWGLILERIPLKRFYRRYDEFLDGGWPIWRVWKYLFSPNAGLRK